MRFLFVVVVIVVLLLIFDGCTQKTVPKFKIGDCVTMYNFPPFKIYEIHQNKYLDDYGVVLDASCTAPDRILCGGSSSLYDIKNVDKEGTKVPCPKHKQR